MGHVLLYSDDQDTIEVSVPWEVHSGNIPPALIKFVASDGYNTRARLFIYEGIKDA